jgi:hypothetical protein
MRFLLTALIVGFLFVWCANNIPDFLVYIFVGTLVLLIVRTINKK